MKLLAIIEAIRAILDLTKKPTPPTGEKIIEGGKVLDRIGHVLNTSAAAALAAGISLADWETLYAWWEKDRLFFLIVLATMQLPYLVGAVIKLAGKVQAEPEAGSS